MDRDKALALIDTEISKAEAYVKTLREAKKQAETLGPLFKLDTSGFKFGALTAAPPTKPKGKTKLEPCPFDPSHYPSSGKPGDLFERLKRHITEQHPDKAEEWQSNR